MEENSREVKQMTRGRVNVISWGKIKKHKAGIRDYRKSYGTESAIHYTEGLLGLRRGEYKKHRARIRKEIKKIGR